MNTENIPQNNNNDLSQKSDTAWYDKPKAQTPGTPHWIKILWINLKYSALCGIILFCLLAITNYMFGKIQYIDFISEIYIFIVNAILGGLFGIMFGFPFFSILMLLPDKLFGKPIIKKLIIGILTAFVNICGYNLIIYGFDAALWWQASVNLPLHQYAAILLSGLISVYLIFIFKPKSKKK